MAETNLLAATKKKKNFYINFQEKIRGLEKRNWGSETNASASGGGNWPWTGEKRSSARFRDLMLSFFSDCGSIDSASVVAAGIVLAVRVY